MLKMCAYGCHFDMLKFLLEYKKEYDIDKKDEKLFRTVAYNGDLRTLKWLLKTYPDYLLELKYGNIEKIKI